ncbi:MAG: glycoside hydrolase family 5 protein [Rhizobacter sp.]
MAACGGTDNSDEPENTAPKSGHVVATPAPAPAAPAPAPAQPVTTAKPTKTTAAAIKWRGVNLSGAEFTASTLPGRYGFQYIYPSVSSVDYFKAKGMNLVRLPFLWERLQPTLNGSFDAAELTRLKDFVAGTTAKGVSVLIDPHNFARYRSQVIGSTAVPYSAFGDFWSRLAAEFKGNPRVLFGVMNEPFSMPTETWVAAANEAINRIRATGATNTIAVPGNAWTGAHSWTSSSYGTPNAQAMLQITDSGHNLVFEVHQYLDADSSGTSSVCRSTTIGAERLATFTAWLRTNGKRGLLGEFAGANNDTCKQALAGMLNYLEANSDVWAGWTYWGAGPWWGDNMFSIEPLNGVDKPQMATLQPFLD